MSFLFPWTSLPFCLHPAWEPTWGPSHPNKGKTRRKWLGMPTATNLGPGQALEWSTQQLKQQCPWRCGKAGSIIYFQFPRRSNPMDGLSLRFVSFWLFMVTWYMTCWFLRSIIITFFPNTCYFPSLAAIISPLDYCNHLSDFCALSFAPWTTTPNPFSTMYPKWPFQNTKSIMSFLCLKSLR